METTRPSSEAFTGNATRTDEHSLKASCRLFPDNSKYCVALVCVRIIASVLSVLGCAFTISLIWLLRKYQGFTQRMILHLGIASMTLAIGVLVEGVYAEEGVVCSVQAFLLTFGVWAILLWIIGITANLYLNVVWENSLEQGERYLVIGCWATSGFIGAIPFIGDKYGPAGAWCWIPQHWEWKFGIWYIPWFIAIIGIFVTTIYTTVQLRKKKRVQKSGFDPERKVPLKKDIMRLRAYPVVYLSIMIFPLINRIHNGITEDRYIFPLLLLHTLTAPLMGAVNAIVFGLDKDTFMAIKNEGIRELVKKRLSWKKKTPIKEYEVKEKDEGKETESVQGVPNDGFEQIEI